MWKIALITLSIVTLFACSEKRELTFEEKYPSGWYSDGESWMSIGRALGTSNIGGCGIFEYRPHSQYRSDFLVRCSNDGNNWKYYKVDISNNEARGPFSLASLKKG